MTKLAFQTSVEEMDYLNGVCLSTWKKENLDLYLISYAQINTV